MKTILIVLICLILIFKIYYAITTRYFKNSQLIINNSKTNLIFLKKRSFLFKFFIANNVDQLTLITNDSSVNFFVLADSGGRPVIYRTLTGQFTANQMGRLGPMYNTKFQLNIGDNFYYFGVQDVNDHRFRVTFEDVFDSEHLRTTPWFTQFGNHDYYGNAQAQIDYMQMSNRWIFPNFNYTIDVMINNGKKKLITILMIDTMKLCGNTKFLIDKFNKVKTTSIPKFASRRDQLLADLYFKDLDDKLKQISYTSVPYILVAGHFPVFSAGKHGSTQCLIDRLMPMLHKYKVSAYLSGHDHTLQHYSLVYLNHQIEYIISAASSSKDSTNKSISTIPRNSLKFKWPNKNELFHGGFILAEASEQRITFNFMKSDGSNLYQKVILPRK